MKVIALHFSGPLQSWAGKAVLKTHVDTAPQPSERAIRGLIAAAYGAPRVPHGEEYPEPVASLEIIGPLCLRPGLVQGEFQTIGSRSDEMEYLTRIRRVSVVSKGSGNPAITADARKGTAIVERTYLGDAAFLVLIKGRSDQETNEVLDNLRNPVFSPYLGKKAFAPTFPFLLGLFDEDGAFKKAESELLRIKELVHG